VRRILEASNPKDAAAAIKAFDTTWGRHPGIDEFLTRLESMVDQGDTYHENDPLNLETNMHRLRPNSMYGERPGEDIHPNDLPAIDPEDIDRTVHINVNGQRVYAGDPALQAMVGAGETLRQELIHTNQSRREPDQWVSDDPALQAMVEGENLRLRLAHE